MTFREWMDNPSGFGDFTRLEIFYDTPPNKLREILEEMESAYEAGWDACAYTRCDMTYEEYLEYERSSIRLRD